MTESFILMALGIGIGYSIILWQHRSRATTVAAIGTQHAICSRSPMQRHPLRVAKFGACLVQGKRLTRRGVKGIRAKSIDDKYENRAPRWSCS